MINAEERNRLLEQIAELEKNSVNYFDVEKEFFLIDSDNLWQVRPKLYGYSIQRTGIYEDDNLTAEAIAGLDGRGCYVYVDVENGQITIKQDVNGCYGIYLFRHGDYFALSNSFFRLLDHVKFKYPLTVNRDYCHYLMITLVAGHSYSETAVNEISLIDRNEILYIDLKDSRLEIVRTKYKENSVLLDSQEGVDTLDRWLVFWSNVFRGVVQNTSYISIDLSGGFDSRISFVPALYSGVNLNEIRINSSESKLHTYEEDYVIASQIAHHYGFKLNRPLPNNQFLNNSLSDIFNINWYYQQTFRSIPTFPLLKQINKVYAFCGNGGETIRSYWQMTSQEFINNQNKLSGHYSRTLSREVSSGVEVIIKSAFRAIQKKYEIKDQNSSYLPQYLYKETRCRHHFGKFAAIEHYINNIRCSPAMDPELFTLKLDTPKCKDFNLLIALLFIRYAPDLLTFPFNGNHSIAPETIEYAKKINEHFPRRMTTENIAKVDGGGVFHLSPRDKEVEKVIVSGKNNPKFPGYLPLNCLKEMFDSSKTYGLFTTYFDTELYQWAASFYKTRIFEGDRPKYAVVGITKVIEDVEFSQNNHPPYHDMQRFIEQDFVKIHSDTQIPDKFKNYLTARIDIRLASANGDFEFFSVSDEKATLQKPAWLQNGGIGYQLQSYAGQLSFTAKATVDGKVQMWLRGLDIRDSADRSKRIPYWIDYTKLIINGKTLFSTMTPVWHDKPYTYGTNTKAGEEIKIQVEWQPHRSDA